MRMCIKASPRGQRSVHRTCFLACNEQGPPNERVQFFFDSDYIDMPCTYITNGRQLAKNN